MDNKRRIVIVGATSCIAEHCARLWLTNTCVELILIGRDLSRLECISLDLKVRSPQSAIKLLQADFLDPLSIKAVVDTIASQGEIDIVLIAHGVLSEQLVCQSDLSLCRDMLEINGISPVLFAEAFAAYMALSNRGTLAIIGSVAGDRGRQSNYIYGAAKGLVSRYAQGMQHRFAGSNVNILLIKPGPTDTPMTAHLKDAGAKLAQADKVAKDIVKAIAANKTEVYTPWKWKIIMRIIQHIPSAIFNKLRI